MNSDIRIKINLPKHPKYKRLKRILGVSPMEYLVIFWGYVAEYAPVGNLDGWSCEDIEEASDWRGEPGVFFNSMLDVGFLDKTETGYYPHDWYEHQAWVIGAPDRQEIAKKAGKASGEARRKKSNEHQVQQTVEHCVQHQVQQTVERNANGTRTPSPSPLPSPITLTTEVEERAGACDQMAMSEIQELYVTYVGKIPHNQPIASSLIDVCRKYPPERIRTAFKAVVEANKPNLNWVKKFLDNPHNWHETGGSSSRASPKTFEQIKLDNIKNAIRGAMDETGGLEGIQFIDG